jgi:porin
MNKMNTKTRLASLLLSGFLVAISSPSLLAQDPSAPIEAPAPQTEAPDESLAAQAEVLESGATMFPVPAYAGDLLTREGLSGDWGGLRTTLAEDYGIQIAVDVTQFYLGIWDGGRGRESDYNGSADYRFKFDTEKGGLFPGGFLEVHGETYWGQSINDFTGTILPANTDPLLSQPGGPGTYLPHVIYTQFLAENFAVFFGKLDTTTGDANRFAHGVGDRRFMNLGFSFNPVTMQLVPYSTLGAGFLFLPTEGVTFSFSAVDADGTIDESGFDTVFNGNT